MKRWTLVVVVLALSGAPAYGLGRKPELPPEDTTGAARAESPLDRIATARARGEIDADTATLYEVFAVVDGEQLPEAYRAPGPIRDGTPVLRAARSRYDGLRPEIQERIRPYLFPRGRP